MQWRVTCAGIFIRGEGMYHLDGMSWPPEPNLTSFPFQCSVKNGKKMAVNDDDPQPLSAKAGRPMTRRGPEQQAEEDFWSQA